jgi:hypothetical protein
MTEPVAKRADQLVVDDLVPDEYLPMRFNKGPAKVVFVAAEIGDEFPKGEPHTFFAFRYPNGQHDSTTVRSEAELKVYPADPPGLGASFDSSQMADADATPVPTSRRYEPHFADGNTGVEFSCNGAPAGYEADCGKPGPHGPHGPELVA